MIPCPACLAFDAAERACIEGRDEIPPHTLDGCTCESDPTIAITILAPDRLALTPQRGTHVDVTWAELVRWVSSPVVTDDKGSAGGFVLATLRDGVRHLTHVVGVSALALEHDAGTMAPEDAHAALRRFRHIVYTTWRHTTAAPRWRAIVAVTRPMTPDEHRVVWARAASVIERDAAVDHATKDANRLWYVPTVRPGQESTFEVFTGEGRALDVDRIVARATKREAARRARSTSPQEPHNAGTGDRYFEGALRSAAHAVATAPEGARNATLNKQAHSLARLHISDDRIARALTDAARAAGLTSSEVRKTIASALRARRGGA